jgi:hypothetical protein
MSKDDMNFQKMDKSEVLTELMKSLKVKDGYVIRSCRGGGICGFDAFGIALDVQEMGSAIHWLLLNKTNPLAT